MASPWKHGKPCSSPGCGVAQVSNYEAIQEATVAKTAARKLLRQIEESEERAEVVEVSYLLCVPHHVHDFSAPALFGWS